MRNNILNFVIVFFMGINILSCGTYDQNEISLNHSLELSGQNRRELEFVLSHFSKDSLKLEAAKYLIRNMPGHYSYVDTFLISYYSRSIDSILATMKSETDYNKIRDSIDIKAHVLGIDSLKMIEDCQFVSANYLIKNIDSAFDVWQNGLWAKHLSFDEFCECLLPYKVEELQPLDDWRRSLKDSMMKYIDELKYCDQLHSSPFAATRLLNNYLLNSLNPVTELSILNTHISACARLKIPFAQCNDYAAVASMIFRSLGIPVFLDFTPQWAKRSMGHTWNVLLSDDGREIPFGGITSTFGEYHKPEEKLGKVYRYTYSPNLDLVELNRSNEFVPPLFQNVFLRDVTKKYAKCSDVTIRIDTDILSTMRYAYLFVFDNFGWSPIAYGTIKGNNVIFREIGRDVLYLPAIYREGKMEPISCPFILRQDGRVCKISKNTSSFQELVLRRKYPVMEYAYSFIPRLLDGELQASNDIGFKKYYVVHHINKCAAFGQEALVPNTIPPCRYWRYINYRKASFCSISELIFYSSNSTKLTGTVIGTDGSFGGNPMHTKEMVFDGDILTSFDAPHGEGCWVGLDFQKPVVVDKIVFFPRCDGNCVEIGHEYELLYWDNLKWKRLGHQIASDLYVKFNNVPKNCIYWLRDLTKGHDERIFTIENGQQVWW